MSERMLNNILNKQLIKRTNKLYDKVTEGLGDDISARGIGALEDRVRKYLKSWNVTPTYIKEKEGKLGKLRAKLNSEAGIIISNHPGDLEIPIILSCLERDDIKIMVSAENDNHKQLERLLGTKYTAPAFRDRRIMNVLIDIESHIKGGGILLMFPSGGRDGVDIRFEGAFGHLVRKLSPEKMIYSFFFGVPDFTKAKIPNNKWARMILLAGNLEKNLLEGMILTVDEDYSQAGEWQTVCSSARRRKDEREIFRKHYLKKFVPELFAGI